MRLFASLSGLMMASAMLLSACAQPTSQAVNLTPAPTFEVVSCAPDIAALGREATCAILRVPQNRAAPGGLIVSTPVVVFRAAVGAPAKMPVVYLHGGPGGSVMANLAVMMSRPWAKATFTTDRDWVFFDQRGAGRSAPRLDCGELSLTDAGIANDADLAAFETCVAGHVKAGVDFAFYNAKTIADDIQDLRRALGYEAFDLFGVSYGARVALAVAQHRPEGLRAMALDSPYPPEAKGTQELPRITAGLVRQLLRSEQQLEERFATMIAAWEKDPPDGVTVDDLGQFLVDTLYSGPGVANFKTTAKALIAGKTDAVRSFVATRSNYDEAQNIAHFCKEELPFEQEARMHAVSSSDPIARAVARAAARYFAACKLIAVGAPDPREIEPYTGAIPALFLVAGIDPGCPLEFNAPAAEKMPNAQLVLFAGRTHGVSRDSPCAQVMLRSFLDAPTAKVNRTCLAQEPKAL